MEASSPTIDRAQWGRYKNTGERCVVCGGRAEVSVSITATELDTEDEPGRRQTNRGMLAREKYGFCNVHGIERFGCGMRALMTGSATERR